MGAVTGQTIITTVSTLVQDPTNIRWLTTELLGYLNDAQREISLYKPSASVVTTNLQIVPGTRQSLPLGGLVLVDVIRNMGTGSTPGPAIRIVAREILDSQQPTWHTSAAASNVVKHYTYSILTPKIYYVYPYQTGNPTTFIEATYGAIPVPLNALTDTITVDDIYVSALVNYICYRAYSKDAEYAANAAASQKYYELFMGEMTGKTQGELIANPNIAMAPFNPNVPGAK